MICREKVFGCISGILNQNEIFVFAKKTKKTSNDGHSRNLHVIIFLALFFFLNAITHTKKFLSCLFLCLFFGDFSSLSVYDASWSLSLSHCMSFSFVWVFVFLSLFLMLFSPFSFNLTACALLTWVKSICFWLYGRFPHQNDSEFFPCSKYQSNVD